MSMLLARAAALMLDADYLTMMRHVDDIDTYRAAAAYWWNRSLLLDFTRGAMP